jgi:hypothetical protein
MDDDRAMLKDRSFAEVDDRAAGLSSRADQGFFPCMSAAPYVGG